MSNTIILKKEQHWYVLPETENRNDIILSLVEKENPSVFVDSESIFDMLICNGWSIEEYRDFAVVA